MDLTKLTEEELKARIYDASRAIAERRAEIQQLEAELAKRSPKE